MTKNHFSAILLLVSMTITLWSCPSAAQSNNKKARAKFNEGVGLYNNEKYAEAAKAFEEAYALKPIYKILYNIGQA